MIPSNYNDHDEKTALLSNNMSERSAQSICLLPGMKIRAHGIARDGSLTTIEAKAAIAGARKGRGSYWIDVDADERDEQELSDWLQQLEMSPFLLDRLSKAASTWDSQVIDNQAELIIIVRILPAEQESDDLAHMAALLLPNLLLTFTSCPRCDTGGLYAQALARLRATRGSKLPDASCTGALCAWLQFHVERTSQAARQLRSVTLAMDKRMDAKDAQSVPKEQVIVTKDQLLRVLAVAEEQLECVEALAGTGNTTVLDFGESQGSLGVLLATAAATERMALRLNTHLADLRQRHESYQQEHMNRRLALLTVLSAVFLPLTLFTGIWGMNFEYMPELKSPMAYPVALLAMMSIAMAMICFFWKAGWFD